MGDFNLDGGSLLNPNFCNKNLLSMLNDFATENKLIQVVDFNTWSRTIKGTRKESLLDHVYLNNHLTFNSIYFETPTFGDHALVMAELTLRLSNNNKNNSLHRIWSNYNAETLRALLHPPIVSKCNLFINCNVQSLWNLLESVLITVTDTLAPSRTLMMDNQIVKKEK